MILKEDDPSTFSWRMTIPFFGGVIGIVFLSGFAHACCREYLAAMLIEFSNGEFVCTTVMLTTKDILDNWTEKQMCGNYRPVNRKTKLDWYPIPIPWEVFDAIGFSLVFSVIDLKSGYHQLPLFAGD